MSDNLKKFLQEISSDQEWIGKLTALEEKDEVIAQAIAKAAENGITLTAADFEAPEGELSEDELNTVAGGETCACVAGGGGKKTYADELVCACVVGGGGEYEDYYGERHMRCVCFVAGTGERIEGGGKVEEK